MNKLNVKLYLCITIIGAGIIFQLPYLRNIFYIPMIQSYHLSHLQMGILSSVYAAVSLASYFFGGLLVTRYSWKKLLSISFITTGAIGFYLSFCFNYMQLLFGFAVLGITTVLPYFSSSMCINNVLFSVPANGKFQKYLNVGRGAASAALGLLCIFYFILLGGGLIGMRTVILVYSFVSIIFGAILAVILPEFHQERHIVKQLSFFHMNQVLPIIKKPLFFKWCLQIAAAYSVYIFLGAYIPFIVLRYHVSVETSLVLGILRYLCSSIGVVFAVFSAKRISDKNAIFLSGYIIGAICMIALLLLPESYSLVPFAIILFVAASIWVYTCREFYYSLYSASEFTDGQYGLVIGLIAFISYIPEIFLQTFLGYCIGKNAFGILVAVCTVICLIGIISCLSSIRHSNNRREKNGKYTDH